MLKKIAALSRVAFLNNQLWRLFRGIVT